MWNTHCDNIVLATWSFDVPESDALSLQRSGSTRGTVSHMYDLSVSDSVNLLQNLRDLCCAFPIRTHQNYNGNFHKNILVQ